MYDIFFAIYDNETLKNHIKIRFPLAKLCLVDKNNTVSNALLDAQHRSLTKMFWFVLLDQEILEDFNFDVDVPEWDQKYVHAFKNSKVYLIPKSYKITKRESDYVFFVNNKIIDRQISYTRTNDIFFAVYDIEESKQEIQSKYPTAKFCIIDKNHTVQDALYEAQRKSLTSMFWFVDHGFELNDNFDLGIEIPEWDQKYVHVFKDSNAYLIPKTYEITKREAEHLFFVNKKEIEISISVKKMPDIFFAVYDVEEEREEIRSRFPTAKFCIIDENYTVQDALYAAQRRSSTEMFWFVDHGYNLNENFDLDIEIPEWDQKYVHVFKDSNAYLIPKTYEITKREAEHLFFVNKKEIDRQISTKRTNDIFFAVYDVEEEREEIRSRFPTAKFCIIDENHFTQDALYEAQRRSSTDMFWFVHNDYYVSDDFNFNLDVPKWDQQYVHVFKDKSGNYGGVFLISKFYEITKKEAEYTFFVNKKEIDVQII